MIVFISAFGATWAYDNKDIALELLEMFLQSLRNQTSKDFRLVISVHDRPDALTRDDFVMVDSIQVENKKEFTFFPYQLPHSAKDEVVYETLLFQKGIMDCYRKWVNSTIAAIKWGFREGIRDFWIVRVDADDFIRKDTVELIEKAEADGFNAIYANKCYLFENETGMVAKLDFKMPVSFFGYKIHLNENGIVSPAMYLLCHDHAKFLTRAKDYDLKFTDLDYCLMRTCSGMNHITDNLSIDGFKGTEMVDNVILKDFGVN